MPSRSNPNALQRREKGGAKEGNQTLFKHHGNLSITESEEAVCVEEPHQG